jgi:hypothetical protein
MAPPDRTNNHYGATQTPFQSSITTPIATSNMNKDSYRGLVNAPEGLICLDEDNNNKTQNTRFENASFAHGEIELRTAPAPRLLIQRVKQPINALTNGNMNKKSHRGLLIKINFKL